MGVWAMTNRAHIAQGVLPTLSATVINTETFSVPTNVQSPPGFSPGVFALTGDGTTTGLLNTDFDALDNLQYINGQLYAVLNTALNVPGSSIPRDGAAWFKVTPKLNGSIISSNISIAAQGYVVFQGFDILYPEIEHSWKGTTAIAFSFAAPTTYPSSGYVVMSPNSSKI